MKEVEDDDASLRQLPFSERKQDATLGHLLLDSSFFMQARHRIRSGWFVDAIGGKVWTAKCKFYEQYGLIPTVEELRQQGDFLTEDNAIKEKMRRKVSIAINETANFQKLPIQKELEGWLRAVLFKEATSHAVKLFNSEKFTDCYTFLDKRLDDIKMARFVEDQEYNFANITNEVDQELGDRRNALTFGLPIIDKLLLERRPNESDAQGSLLPGDTTILLAPTNIGKTTAMLTIAAHNVVRKKHILIIIHEGRQNDIAMKLMCALMNCSRIQFFEKLKTERGNAQVQRALNALKDFVTFVPLVKAGLTVEDVEPVIRQKQEEQMAKHQGRGFDLVIDDYPAKLTTRQAAGGHLARRHIDEIVYNYFIALAGEYRFHMLCAIQTNRQGSKVNRGHAEDGRLLSMEDVMESWAPMTGATNVISINRDEEAKAKHLVTFYICKSRSNDTGYAIICRSNYANAITHSSKLGGVWYRGDLSRSEQMDEEYLNQYLNSALPNTV